jgi:hypothetical protein
MKAHIIWIVLIKIIFIILSLVYFFMPNDKVGQYKDKVEAIFFISMAILLIYIFNPYIPHTAIIEEKRLLFLFGIVILITTQWKKILSTA